MAESFFGTLKTELIYRHSWTSRHDAELAIFTWIEGWYNTEQIIAALAVRSPDEYEAGSTLTPPPSTPPSMLETTNRASDEPGDPHWCALPPFAACDGGRKCQWSRLV
jgi:Integrase core domain